MKFFFSKNITDLTPTQTEDLKEKKHFYENKARKKNLTL